MTAGRQGSGPEQLDLGDIRRLLDAGVFADVQQGRLAYARNELEVVVLHMQGRVLDDLILGIPGKETDVVAVPAFGLAKLVDADVAAAARHVAHDDAGNAGQVFGQILGDDPRLDVGRTA